MAWIESHASLREHPKTKRLCRLLKLKRWEAVGLLHFLWWWALDYVPEGDLSAITDEDIADAVDWRREASELVAGLTLAGFLDEGRRLHDWQDYAGRWIDRRAANAERMRRAREERRRNARAAHEGRTFEDAASTSHKSVQLPDLNRTGPNRTVTGPPPPTPPATAREGGGSLPLAEAQGHENGGYSDPTSSPPPPVAGVTTRREKPVLNGRNGHMGCPSGCPTNHGGPMAARFLGEDWLAIPPEQRPAWGEYLARHGRPDLADVPAPKPVTIVKEA